MYNSDNVVARAQHVLDAMELGVIYRTNELAEATGISMGRLHPLLRRLARAGVIARVHLIQQGVPSGWRRRK